MLPRSPIRCLGKPFPTVSPLFDFSRPPSRHSPSEWKFLAAGVAGVAGALPPLGGFVPDSALHHTEGDQATEFGLRLHRKHSQSMNGLASCASAVFALGGLCGLCVRLPGASYLPVPSGLAGTLGAWRKTRQVLPSFLPSRASSPIAGQKRVARIHCRRITSKIRCPSPLAAP